MNVRVLYHSGYKGNTMKIATTIAEVFNVRAERIGKEKIDFSEPIDLLFIGSGVYFNKPHKKLRITISKLTNSVIQNAVGFGTYGNQSNVGEQINNLLRKQGIRVVGESFVCKGASVGTDNKGHPDTTDLENAKEFANNIALKI